jgi:N-hydroxyarylamine O-acetyltransferase
LLLLRQLQEQHLRCIPFENIDVVLGQRISMAPADVQCKLLHVSSGSECGRGGYCFEHNTLMMLALKELGYVVQPLLARVRWNKSPDELTTFTHMLLRVSWLQDDEAATTSIVPASSPPSTPTYLVDVGFGGIGPLWPLALHQAATHLPSCNESIFDETHVVGSG